jgi:uridine kinase
MQICRIHENLADQIIARRPIERPMIVGIDGASGSGKTTLARLLAETLDSSGISVCRVSIDDFHNPKSYRYRRGETSPESYYRDSFNFQAFARGALKPAFEGSGFPVRCQTKLLDLERDEEDLRFEELPVNGVLLAEGVFLFRPEIVRYLDMRILVHANVDVILERVQQRDINVLGSADAITARYRAKYIRGEQMYFDEVRPETVADLIVENDDPAEPLLRFPAR